MWQVAKGAPPAPEPPVTPEPPATDESKPNTPSLDDSNPDDAKPDASEDEEPAKLSRGENESTATVTSSDTPQTGDATNILLWSAAALISALVGAVLLIIGRKKNCSE